MREQIEHRITEILGYIDSADLVGENNEMLALFSYEELKIFLHFLENGDYAQLGTFIQQKFQKIQNLEGQAKNLEGKVKVEKQRTIEQSEQKVEEQELENLFNFE